MALCYVLEQLVKDVHQFEGHIACDDASNSEVVVPVFSDGELVGVLVGPRRVTHSSDIPAYYACTP